MTIQSRFSGIDGFVLRVSFFFFPSLYSLSARLHRKAIVSNVFKYKLLRPTGSWLAVYIIQVQIPNEMLSILSVSAIKQC